MAFELLTGLQVLDLSTGIAGPYATKLLADAGADVVKIENADGDPLRRWVASGVETGDADGPLFQFLNSGKRSVVGDVSSDHVRLLLDRADLLVEGGGLPHDEVAEIRRRHPLLCIVSVTPFGRTGPWASRAATEFTMQAAGGAISWRGTLDREPLHVGGRLGEWIAGAYSAVAALAVLRGTRISGRGDHVDLSIFESICNAMTGASPLAGSLAAAVLRGTPPPTPTRTVEVPSIEPTADGYVGFCTITAQQIKDFFALIGRPQLGDDPELLSVVGRVRRRDEIRALLQTWIGTRTTEEVVDEASVYRLPVTPVGMPETLTGFDQFVERGVFARNPGGFVQPRVPYQVDETSAHPLEGAPALGAHADQIDWEAHEAPPVRARELPLAGIRVVDLTAFWAGPTATHLLALLGADVIKVESTRRPDGMRFVFAGEPATVERWWEWSSGYQMVNVNKRAVTLDLESDDGRRLLLSLIARSDAVIENFSPRVTENFGVTWEAVHQANPRAVMVRMPAFGLSGPWRDRTGFAQTIEQVSGMAWMTGFGDGPPIVPRGACDPLAGIHAAFALLAALEDQERSGRGHLIEVPMVEVALNAAAEVTVEHSAFGVSLIRNGNRGPVSAPQGLYACRDDETWLALAVATDDQWRGLRAVLGDPAWARADAFKDPAGRRARHDEIDKHLAAWAKARDVAELVDVLTANGVPAEEVVLGTRLLANPQLEARGFFETVEGPLTGRHPYHVLPFRLASATEPSITRVAPALGEHNREVLGGLLGLSEDELARLEQQQVIGERPLGA
jgi:crotonobetainyl-CoA:carnitine CoA-transferase CaiB-like acyl-CoA transferase